MELAITFEGRHLATLVAANDEVRLSYSVAWQAAPDHFPISLRMPVDGSTYKGDIVLLWLMNLLPEGDPLRAMTRVVGATADDVLGLIARTGTDLAGALSIGLDTPGGTPDYREITGSDALERIISDLPARPFLVDEEGVSMSLAGAQDKLPVAKLGDAIGVPMHGAPSTHILKPDNPRLLGSVQNEALCMVLARRAGLLTAPVTTGLAGQRSYLLVTRYDREGEPGAVRRIHQEDFCQSLGRPPVAKYEYNGTGTRGPSIADFFATVRAHMTAREITQLLDAVIFNIAIGNVDSHAKNYSVLLTHQANRFAPLYDLMSGLGWANITQNHAQAIGGQRRGRHIYASHWQRMAEASGLSPKATVRRVEAVTARLLRELPRASEEVAAMPAGPGLMLKVFEREIAQRIGEVRAHAQEPGDEEYGAPGNDDADQIDATTYHG
jgi:serine/threonine-protein kinase HipA